MKSWHGEIGVNDPYADLRHASLVVPVNQLISDIKSKR
jgi:hypothetical protein